MRTNYKSEGLPIELKLYPWQPCQNSFISCVFIMIIYLKVPTKVTTYVISQAFSHGHAGFPFHYLIQGQHGGMFISDPIFSFSPFNAA